MKTLENIFSEEFISAIGWTLLHSLWQGALIALLLGVSLLFLQKKSATLRYNIGASAIVLTFIAFLGTFTFLYQNELNTASLNDETVLVVVDATNQTNPAFEAIQNQSLFSIFTDYFNHHLPIIVVLWLLGVMVLSLRFLGGIAYLERLKYSKNRPLEAFWQVKMTEIKNTIGVKQSIELLESALIKVPMVVGYLKPIILLPIGTINALSAAEVEAILAHELAHIRRNDYLINLVQSIIDVLFFYHPAVWWMSNTVRTERENCCDDLALKVTGNSLIIAKALANLEAIRMSNHQLSMAFTGNKNQLFNRISRLLGQPMKKNNQFLESIIAVFIIIICLTTVNYNVNANTEMATLINVEATIDTVKPLSTTIKVEKIINENQEEIIEEYIIIEEESIEESSPSLFEWVSSSNDFPNKVEDNTSSRFFLNGQNELEVIDLKRLKSENKLTFELPKTTSNNIFGDKITELFPNDANFKFEFKDEKLTNTFKGLDLNLASIPATSSFFIDKENGLLDLNEEINFDNIEEIKIIKGISTSIDTSILDKYEDADIIFIDGDKTVIIRSKKKKETRRVVVRGLSKKAEKEAQLAQIKAERIVLRLEKQQKLQEKAHQERLKAHENQVKGHQKNAEKRAELANIRAEKIIIREGKRTEREIAKMQKQQERLQKELKGERKRLLKDQKKREADTKEIEAELIKDGLLKEGKHVKTLDVNDRNGKIQIKVNGKKIPEDKLKKYIEILKKQQLQLSE
jgi:beta-lactamase regulating signal transducer with metallopeptidase domain